MTARDVHELMVAAVLGVQLGRRVVVEYGNPAATLAGTVAMVDISDRVVRFDDATITFTDGRLSDCVAPTVMMALAVVHLVKPSDGIS